LQENLERPEQQECLQNMSLLIDILKPAIELKKIELLNIKDQLKRSAKGLLDRNRFLESYYHYQAAFLCMVSIEKLDYGNIKECMKLLYMMGFSCMQDPCFKKTGNSFYMFQDILHLGTTCTHFYSQLITEQKGIYRTTLTRFKKLLYSDFYAKTINPESIKKANELIEFIEEGLQKIMVEQRRPNRLTFS